MVWLRLCSWFPGVSAPQMSLFLRGLRGRRPLSVHTFSLLIESAALTPYNTLHWIFLHNIQNEGGSKSHQGFQVTGCLKIVRDFSPSHKTPLHDHFYTCLLINTDTAEIGLRFHFITINKLVANLSRRGCTVSTLSNARGNQLLQE